MNSSNTRRDRLIAALATLLLLAGLGSWLWFDSLTLRPREATAAKPAPSEREEIFIEPVDPEELMMDAGEEDATAQDAPAPNDLGEPKPAEEDNDRKITPGQNPTPRQTEQQQVSTNRPSSVQSSEPTQTDREAQAVTSRTNGKFDPHNGKPDGKPGFDSAANGDGISISGKANGRTMKSCPKPSVTTRQNKTTVTVTVYVNAEGTVTKVSGSSGGSKEQRTACENAARQSKWSPKRGAADAVATITFTIVL